MTDQPRFSWTQPICEPCYLGRYPGRTPTRLVDTVRERETCVDCGNPTQAGIYIRTDPATAAHPTRTK